MSLIHEAPVATNPEHAPISAEREAALRRLLDPPIIDDAGQSYGYGNYEYAQESGLIDMFAYDPDTNVDGLMHVLVGDVKERPDGTTEVGGFHINPDPLHAREMYNSFEETEHLANPNRATRKHFVRRPFEPYRAHVTVQGRRKYSLEKDETGKMNAKPIANGMFPAEYDALAVMQATRIALENRDPNNDVPNEKGVMASSTVPMIDGKTSMQMRLFLNHEGKVLSAYPLVKESGYMKLGAEAVDRVLNS